MLRYVALRLLRMVPALLGITLVTFALIELAPGSREELAVQGLGPGDEPSRGAGAPAMAALREQWGMTDPVSKEPYSLGRRYLAWLSRACALDVAGPGEDPAEFRRRIERALPVSLLLNALALLVAFGIAIPLGARLGMRAGGAFDRVSSGVMFLLWGVPEFLLATLLLLVFAGGWWAPWLPSRGLTSDGAADLPLLARAFDLAQHLVLPVAALALGPCIAVARFVRDGVARAAASDFALAMRAWGLPEKVVRGRALHNGLSPLVTLLGVLLPALVGGSVVVESVFSLPGLGLLAFEAAMRQEVPMVMAMTVLAGAATLLSLLLSDVLHRVVDPRVTLQ